MEIHGNSFKYLEINRNALKNLKTLENRSHQLNT